MDDFDLEYHLRSGKLNKMYCNQNEGARGTETDTETETLILSYFDHDARLCMTVCLISM